MQTGGGALSQITSSQCRKLVLGVKEAAEEMGEKTGEEEEEKVKEEAGDEVEEERKEAREEEREEAAEEVRGGSQMRRKQKK